MKNCHNAARKDTILVRAPFKTELAIYESIHLTLQMSLDVAMFRPPTLPHPSFVWSIKNRNVSLPDGFLH